LPPDHPKVQQMAQDFNALIDRQRFQDILPQGSLAPSSIPRI
jgi:hypothetical protein